MLSLYQTSPAVQFSVIVQGVPPNMTVERQLTDRLITLKYIVPFNHLSFVIRHSDLTSKFPETIVTKYFQNIQYSIFNI